MILKVLKSVLGFVTSIVLARLLGPKQYGIYAYTLSWVYLLIMPALFGVPVLLTREVAKYKAKEDWPRLGGILTWSYKLVFVAAFTTSLISLILYFCFVHKIDIKRVDVVIYGILILLFLTNIKTNQGAIRGIGKVVESQIPKVLFLPATFFTFILCLQYMVELSASIVLAIRVISTAGAALLGWCMLKWYILDEITFDKIVYESNDWRHSVVPFFISTSSHTLNENVLVIVSGTVIGAEAAGVLDIVKKAGKLIPFLASAIRQPIGPLISDLYNSSEYRKLNKIVVRSSQVSLVASLLMACILIYFRDEFLGLFGSGFVEGNLSLVIFAGSQVVSAGFGIYGSLLLMSELANEAATINSCIAVFNILLATSLSLHFGMIGVVVGVSVSAVVRSVLQYYLSVRETGVGYWFSISNYNQPNTQ